jgi:hypothetical protein
MLFVTHYLVKGILVNHKHLRRLDCSHVGGGIDLVLLTDVEIAHGHRRK